MNVKDFQHEMKVAVRCHQCFYQCPNLYIIEAHTFHIALTRHSQLYFRMFESKTLESKIEESNVGHQMLKKMGTQHSHVFAAEVVFFDKIFVE